MTLRRFAELATLPISDLRALLDDADAPVRIHAAWQLGLRLGAEVLPDLVSRLDTEPSVGVRRHLLVVLAGQGERRVLAHFAQFDPDPLVQATAAGLLARLAEPDDAESYEALVLLVTHHDAEVRRMLLNGLRPDAPAVMQSAVRARLDDASLEVRRAAMDRRLDVHGGVVPVVDEVAEVCPQRLVDGLAWVRDQEQDVTWEEVGGHLRRLGPQGAEVGSALFATRPKAAPRTYWLEWMALGALSLSGFERVTRGLVEVLDEIRWDDLELHEKRRVEEILERVLPTLHGRSTWFYVGRVIARDPEYSLRHSFVTLNVWLAGSLLRLHPDRERWRDRHMR
ncbi:MAG: hypothetical protein AAGF11_38960 [Myxococcota bacterium]